MNYVLINSKSHNGQNTGVKETIAKIYEGKETKELDVISLNGKYEEFLKEVTKEDEILLVGGDGTLNHFVNDVKGLTLPCNVYFLPAGTGNDFKNDVKDRVMGDGRILLNGMIEKLPTVIVNGKESLFINGIGYGIDGYCCEEGDRLQAKSDKPVNYTAIAIKGLLYKFKPSNAKVTVDGVTKEFKKVWLAPTMKGRFYGGGMMIAPMQSRYDEEGLVTCVVLHKTGKLKTLIVFPTIFEGKHIEHEEMFDIRAGKDIVVEFDKPQALQIDGETVKNVLRYEVHVK